MLYIFAMHSINTQLPDHKIFVAEPEEVRPVEVIDHPSGNWLRLDCIVKLINDTVRAQLLFVKNDKLKSISFIPTVYFDMANKATDFVAKYGATLPRSVKYALSEEPPCRETYYWREGIPASEWSTEDYKPKNEWEEFIYYPEQNKRIVIRKQEEHDISNHYRLDIVTPRPWETWLIRSFLLWTPNAKTPRRYKYTQAGIGSPVMLDKLTQSGFNIPAAVADCLRWRNSGKLRIWWKD